jgi:hypothetical protein
MSKWKLKGCPRCKGDLLVERLQGRWDEYCLQCGYRRDLKVISAQIPTTDGISPALAEESKVIK